MRKLLLLIFTFSVFQNFANSIGELLINHPFGKHFKKAYNLNPSIPNGILEAVAFSQTRFAHLDESAEPSCIAYPRAYGVMGLTENGQGYFRNNLVTVSQLSGFSVADIKQDPEKNILAYAKAFSVLQQQQGIYGSNIADYKSIFISLSELPLLQDLQNDFAMNSQLYQLYWFLSKGDFQDFYGFPDYHIDLRSVFGNNYDVLSSTNVSISGIAITGANGSVYRSSGAGTPSVASPDYGPALWNPTTCNFSSRNGTAITAVAIHDIEGTYAGCISWFKNCSAQVSAHYVARSSDGQITQMVYEADKAWHIGSENPYTLGIEHEGYASTGYNWYTTAMLMGSADLVRDMCTSNSINPLRCYYGPGCSGTTQQCLQGACTKIKGHQMYPNQTHNDPGQYWNWDKFYKYLNNAPVITTVTATSGNFYDTGGAASNYTNDERKLWLFQPSGGATSVSMNFTSFNLENNYDYMFIYDGNNVFAPLIGKYTNTVTPGNINSTGSSLLIEFRSDCATTSPGWAATYTTNAAPTNTIDNVIPTTQITTTGTWKTTNFTTTFTDADAGGSGLEKSYYQVIDYNGTEWRGNATHGFFSDNFDNAIHPDWIQSAGTWTINGNALEQTLQSTGASSNTSISAALTQTLSNRYLYHFKGKIDGTGTNRRAGLHFFVDNPALPNRGNSYFVYFRLDAPKIQIYKTVNDVFYLKADSGNVSILPNQWYDYKVIFDRITGKIDVYKDNTLAATWTDNTPLVAGDVSPLPNGNFISFRSGDCKWSIDEIKIFRSRPTASVSISVGSGNTNDIRYQNPNPLQAAAKIKSIVNDGSGNLSAIDYEDVNVDWTALSNIVTANDGLTADIDVVTTSDSLSANWSSSVDPHSAIARYWYSIGTTPGATNTQTWTSTWADTAVTVHGLALTPGQVYYFNIKSEDGAGMFSSVMSTNGQTVSVATGAQDKSIDNAARIYPNPFTQNFEVELDLSSDSDVELVLFDALGKEIMTHQSKESSGLFKTTINTNSLGLSRGNYFLKIRVNSNECVKKLVKS